MSACCKSRRMVALCLITHPRAKAPSAFLGLFQVSPQLLGLHLAHQEESEVLTYISIPSLGVLKTVPGLTPRGISCHVPLTSQGCCETDPSLTLMVSRFTSRKQRSQGLNTRAPETLHSPTTLFLFRISLADFSTSPCQLPSQQLAKTLSLQLKLYL